MGLHMPERNSVKITWYILKEKPEVCVFVLTAYPLDPLDKRTLDAGVLSLLKKPFETSKILDSKKR